MGAGRGSTHSGEGVLGEQGKGTYTDLETNTESCQLESRSLVAEMLQRLVQEQYEQLTAHEKEGEPSAYYLDLAVVGGVPG